MLCVVKSGRAASLRAFLMHSGSCESWASLVLVLVLRGSFPMRRDTAKAAKLWAPKARLKLAQWLDAVVQALAW